MTDSSAADGFAALGLPPVLLTTLSEVGYERPSPIQAATIPLLLAGHDVLGQAQTGTGKTAAFALPILSRLELVPRKPPQALVLAPTRELAIQVAEAFQTYAAHLDGFQIVPIYGGQSYGPQLAGLRRGAQVVVGTPGRVIDHLERGSLDLSALRYMVLDEADEMLRMGFIDDVDKVLAATPPTRQVALFSATMPPPIRKIAQQHLHDPREVTIAGKTSTAANIHQRYWWVSGLHKLDAMTRILEVEPFDAMLVFARTKKATEELAGKLAARGFAAAAINGDMAQAQRERAVQQLRDGQLDILVATDVAARGLDVDRISHVLNYDIPYDTESYVHRIGRTGRAGRSGEAILFVSPRERGMLRAIERATRQPIEEMRLPSVQDVNDHRVTRFMERIDATLTAGGLETFQALVARYEAERNVPAAEIAAALAKLAHGDKPLFLDAVAAHEHRVRGEHDPRRERGDRRSDDGDVRPARQRHDHRDEHTESAPRGTSRTTAERPDARPETEATRAESRPPRSSNRRDATRPSRDDADRPRRPRHDESVPMETWRVEVGHVHGVQPANIVGAIANEAGIESRYIGRIDIRDDHSFVDLPEGMPPEIVNHLRKVWVCQQPLRIHRDNDSAPVTPPSRRSRRDENDGERPPRRPHAGPKARGGFKPNSPRSR